LLWQISKERHSSQNGRTQAKAHRIPREKVIRDVLLGQQPNKRFAIVEELGALSVFLASGCCLNYRRRIAGRRRLDRALKTQERDRRAGVRDRHRSVEFHPRDDTDRSAWKMPYTSRPAWRPSADTTGLSLDEEQVASDRD
jgi:hypothetical protein